MKGFVSFFRLQVNKDKKRLWFYGEDYDSIHCCIFEIPEVMKKVFIFCGCFVLFALHAATQVDVTPSFRDTLEVYDGLFIDSEPMHLTLKFDVKKFQRTRRKEKYQSAEMTCQVNDTFRVTHPVRVKARGNFRRDNCSVPPFWLNIKYSGIEAPLLEGLISSIIDLPPAIRPLLRSCKPYLRQYPR